VTVYFTWNIGISLVISFSIQWVNWRCKMGSVYFVV